MASTENYSSRNCQQKYEDEKWTVCVTELSVTFSTFSESYFGSLIDITSKMKISKKKSEIFLDLNVWWKM